MGNMGIFPKSYGKKSKILSIFYMSKYNRNLFFDCNNETHYSDIFTFLMQSLK